MTEGRPEIPLRGAAANRISSAVPPPGNCSAHPHSGWLNDAVSRRLADSNRCIVPLAAAQPCAFAPETRPEGQLVTPEIGARLASLADGEGCFIIARQHKAGRTTHQCSFAVKMRADDGPFLERWRDELRFGRIVYARASADAIRRNRPSVSWVVSRQAACLALVAIFDAHPLWSKKARDFAIWRDAVRFWAQIQPLDDQEPLAALHLRLRDARRYEAA